jgi:hypothetical protein
VTHEVGEGAGEVTGPGDVRAGEPDLKQPLVLALGERLSGPHYPDGLLLDIHGWRTEEVDDGRCYYSGDTP